MIEMPFESGSHESHADHDAGDGPGRYAALFEAATPALYRKNAFRLVGVPVHASSRDIMRQADRLRIAERLGAAAGAGSGALALDPAPDGEAVREAMQRLRDPERRLIEELFWFWPLEPDPARPDAALAALAKGSLAEAQRIWVQHGTDGVAVHNLAVLAHCKALDLELAGRTLGAAEIADRDRLWREALAHWSAVAADENVWTRLTARIRELDDPRLTTGIGRRLRASLPLALLSINASLAVSLAEQGARDEGARHAKLARGSSFGEGPATDALRHALQPLRQRIRTLCDTAEAEANRDPVHAHVPTSRLLEQAQPILKVFDLLPRNDAIRGGTCDEVALRALTCQIAYANKTEDWAESLALLERAVQFAVSSSARDRLNQNIATVRKNCEVKREWGTCYFCGKNAPSDACGVDVKMHGEVTHTPTYNGTQINWRTLTIKVPRCESCKGRHNKADVTAALAFLALSITGVGFCASTNGSDSGLAAGWSSLVLGGLLAFVLKLLLQDGVKGQESASNFSAVQTKKAEGWAMGEKPQGVQ